MKGIVRAGIVATVFALAGCAHHLVAFHELNYPVAGKKFDAGVTAVVDKPTLTKTVQIRAWMAGMGNKWEAQPGQMLKQVADVELPQAFAHYRFATDYETPRLGRRRVTLVMDVPYYSFEDFHATVTVHAIAYAPRKRVLFDKTYTASGIKQGGKMFWAGAFGMKSAIRQSSLDAYKQIFARLRTDLDKAMGFKASSRPRYRHAS